MSLDLSQRGTHPDTQRFAVESRRRISSSKPQAKAKAKAKAKRA